MGNDRRVKRTIIRRIEPVSFAYRPIATDVLCGSQETSGTIYQDRGSIEVLLQMGREAVQLVRQAVGAGSHAYVLVNNRSEGNAPLTVEGLEEMLGRLTR